MHRRSGRRARRAVDVALAGVAVRMKYAMATPEPPPNAPIPRTATLNVTDRDQWDRISSAILSGAGPRDAGDDALNVERKAMAKELAAMRRYVKELEIEREASEERAAQRERDARDAEQRANAGDARNAERLAMKELEMAQRERELILREEELDARARATEDAEVFEANLKRRAARLDERERAMRNARDDLDLRDDQLTEAIVGLERENEAVRRETAAMERRREEIVRELTDREVGVLKREESATEREHELRVVEGRLGALKERASDEEARLRRAIERADAAEKREADVARRLHELENDEQRVRTNLREVQADVGRAVDVKASAQRETDALKKDVEILRGELSALTAEKARQVQFIQSVRSDLDERERETADAAEIAANECEAIAVAWDEIESMRSDLERQEKMIEDTAAQLEENVKAFDRDATAMRERQEENERKLDELREHEEFLRRLASENESKAREVSTLEAEIAERLRDVEAREAEVAEWRPQIDEFKSKRVDIEAHAAAIETAKTQLVELSAREKELEEKELQLERREEAAARQLSAAAEAEVILNEENAKLEQKLQEMAPNLIAAELEREVVELKMELERTKAAANAVMANADMERRRREEEESSSGAAAGDADPFAAVGEEKIRQEERARAEQVLESKTAALLRANALLDARENELAKREFALTDELERLEHDTARLLTLQDEVNERMKNVLEVEMHGIGGEPRKRREDASDYATVANAERHAATILADAEEVRRTARAHLEAATATAQAARAINDACESSEREGAATIKRVSAVVASAIQAAKRQGDELRARREQASTSVVALDRDAKIDLLDAQLEYVAKAKADLDRREASIRSDSFAAASRRRANAATSNDELSSRARTARLREEVHGAAEHLLECLSQGETALARAAAVLHAPRVSELRLKLAGLLGVADRLARARVDVSGDDTEEDILSDRLAALEHEIRRAGGWFEDLRRAVREV